MGTLLATALGVGSTRGIDWIELIIQIALAAAGVALVAGWNTTTAPATRLANAGGTISSSARATKWWPEGVAGPAGRRTPEAREESRATPRGPSDLMVTVAARIRKALL